MRTHHFHVHSHEVDLRSTRCQKRGQSPAPLAWQGKRSRFQIKPIRLSLIRAGSASSRAMALEGARHARSREMPLLSGSAPAQPQHRSTTKLPKLMPWPCCSLQARHDDAFYFFALFATVDFGFHASRNASALGRLQYLLVCSFQPHAYVLPYERTTYSGTRTFSMWFCCGGEKCQWLITLMVLQSLTLPRLLSCAGTCPVGPQKFSGLTMSTEPTDIRIVLLLLSFTRQLQKI